MSPAQKMTSSTLFAGFRVLGVAIRREPVIFTIAVLGSALFGALTVADAWVLGWSTDHVLLPAFKHHATTTGGLIAVVALFLGVALLRALGILARRLGAGVLQYRMQATYRREVTRQYLRLPLSWHQQHPTGELLSNANSDVEAAWAPLAPLPLAVGTVFMMVVAVVQMLLVDTSMALVGLLIFPLLIGVNLIFQRLSSPLFTRIQQLRAQLSEVAHESFEGALVIKTLGREANETERFAAKANELRDLGIRAGRIRAGFDPILLALPEVGVLAVLIVGAIRVRAGDVQPGSVVTIAYLLTVVAFPISSLGWMLAEFPRSVVGFDRVRRVLDERARTPYGDRTVPERGEGARLEVDGVRFGYVPGVEVLRDLTFAVEPGRTVAIVGETASGKSTLTALLARLVDPTAGRICIDGAPVDQLVQGELARHVALVPQTAFLFEDTVRDNVTLGAPLTDDEVWQALQTAQAAEFVRALPEGLDARLGERGTTLSGGQRQRLSLARALARRPRLLVLDDATSAVDPEVEQRILAAMRQRTGGTLVLIAYRKATIALADEVLYLADGHIVDRGPHEDLLRRNADYAALVNAYESESVEVVS
ncbi:MAG: ABC transporter ATP-binding protein [Marmoricola sp.]